MGILNVTPDSFFDGGKFFAAPSAAIDQALKMEGDGAAILDIGAESSRPGAEPVSAREEISRLDPIVPQLVRNLRIPISLDTQKAQVARWGLERGVRIINDISGFRDPKMIEVASEFRASAIVMHMQGEPRTMQATAHYHNLISEIFDFLKNRVETLQAAGIQDIAVDPGIGFGKTLPHNLLILKNLSEFKKIGVPIAIGTSRKSFIGKVNAEINDDRLAGSIASNIFAYWQGASILRVHDVKETCQAIGLIDAIENSNASDSEFQASQLPTHLVNRLRDEMGVEKCS